MLAYNIDDQDEQVKYPNPPFIAERHVLLEAENADNRNEEKPRIAAAFSASAVFPLVETILSKRG